MFLNVLFNIKDALIVNDILYASVNISYASTFVFFNALYFPLFKFSVELLEEVSLDSNSFQKYLLPAVVQQYRDPTSRASFEYEKAFLVHNDKLNTEVRTVDI